MTAYSILIAWSEDHDDQGSYSWFGHADDLEQAERQARIESVDSDDGRPEDEDRSADEIMALDDDEFEEWIISNGGAWGPLLDSFEGVNIWAAKDLLDALKAANEALYDLAWKPSCDGSWFNKGGFAYEATELADAAIAKATGKEG